MRDFYHKHQKSIQIILKCSLVLYVFALCFLIAWKTDFNTAPDEAMKYSVCQYIMENLSLPDGRDPSIRNEIWGISYAFSPYLSYIIGGLLMRLALLVTSSPTALLLAARFVSILCIIGYAIMCFKIGGQIFKENKYKWLFVVMATLLPQILYLGGYINNDSLALFSVSIIVYAWITGLKNDWDWKTCILLAVGVGICALSYYNAYGYILCSALIFLISCWQKKISCKKILARCGIMLGIVVAMSGWFFVRNAVIYDGDMIGITAQRIESEQYAMDNFKPSQRNTMAKQGVGLWYMLRTADWTDITEESFVGVFGGLDLKMPAALYVMYFVILLGGILGFVYTVVSQSYCKNHGIKNLTTLDRIDALPNRKLLLWSMVVSIIIPIGLSIYYSYFNDFQPQGRYIMPIIIPLFIFVVIGLKNLLDALCKKDPIKSILVYTLVAFWIAVPIYAVHLITTTL